MQRRTTRRNRFVIQEDDPQSCGSDRRATVLLLRSDELWGARPDLLMPVAGERWGAPSEAPLRLPMSPVAGFAIANSAPAQSAKRTK